MQFFWWKRKCALIFVDLIKKLSAGHRAQWPIENGNLAGHGGQSPIENGNLAAHGGQSPLENGNLVGYGGHSATQNGNLIKKHWMYLYLL